jgi:hypothetical protein
MEGLLRLPGNWIPASMPRRISKVTAASFVLLASVAMMWALIRFWPKRLGLLTKRPYLRLSTRKHASLF